MKSNRRKTVYTPGDGTGFLIGELIKMQKRHFRGGTVIKKMLEEIFVAVKAGGEGPQTKHIRITLLAQSLLLKLIEYAKKNSHDTDNERLQKVYTLIDSQLTEDISISTLAKEANLSESRFKNWFKELSGLTPMDYVQRQRVDYAVRRIRKDTSLSFKDLAYDLNFSSQQYFTTVIKKFTGKSPGELR